MTTLGKIFVVSQFILSLAFAVIAGMFLAHRLPWNAPGPGGGAQAVPGMIEKHDKKIKDLAENWGRLPPRDREASMRELTRDMPQRYREVIQEYFRKLSVQESNK